MRGEPRRDQAKDRRVSLLQVDIPGIPRWMTSTRYYGEHAEAWFDAAVESRIAMRARWPTS